MKNFIDKKPSARLHRRVSNRELGAYLFSAFIFDQILNRWLGSFITSIATTEWGILFSINLVEKVSYLVEISMIIVVIWLIVRTVIDTEQSS